MKNNCFIFDNINSFKGNYACVSINKKWGIIDIEGNWIIKPEYKYLYSANENLFIAEQNKNYGVIDKEKNIIIPFDFEYLTCLNNINYLIAKKNNKFGIINLKGENIIPFDYEYISMQSNEYFVVIKNGKFGCISENNEIVIPFEFDTEFELGNDFIIAGKYQCIVTDNKVQNQIIYGVLDYRNNTIIPFEYKDIKPFDEGKKLSELNLKDTNFSVKTQNDKYIIVNDKNKKINKNEFDEIFSNGAKVYGAKIDKKYCAIDKYGNIKIPCGKFDTIYIFFELNENESAAIAENENLEETIINQNGGIIIPYEEGYKTYGYMYTRYNKILMQKNKKFGVIDRNNNILIPFIYDWLDYEENKYNTAKICDKWGYIDVNGKPLNIKSLKGIKI